MSSRVFWARTRTARWLLSGYPGYPMVNTLVVPRCFPFKTRPAASGTPSLFRSAAPFSVLAALRAEQPRRFSEQRNTNERVSEGKKGQNGSKSEISEGSEVSSENSAGFSGSGDSRNSVDVGNLQYFRDSRDSRDSKDPKDPKDPKDYKPPINYPPNSATSSAAPPNPPNPPDPSNPSTTPEDASWASKLPKAPTKDELLARTTSMLGRLKIKFKWLTIRQIRPFNTDDFSAFFSWLMVGNVLLFIFGTTAFFSAIVFTLNTVFAQELAAELIGNLLTRETGLQVVFEHAVVPGWRDGVLSFQKVFVSRRPGGGKKKVEKGSQASAAAAASASASASSASDVDDGNYTQFDVTIEQVNVTLSVSKWLNGKGILKDVEVQGVRGVVDRRHVVWKPNDDPRNYKNVHRPGDFEIESFKMEDVLVTLYQPGDFRPFRVSIFTCDLPQLRKHWLFYDILNANHMSGSYDESLFTIHKSQRLAAFGTGNNLVAEMEAVPSIWKKVTRLRIDGMNIDHLNTGIEGPFGWIVSGNVDLVADVMIPEEGDGFSSVSELVATVMDNITRSSGRVAFKQHGTRTPLSFGNSGLTESEAEAESGEKSEAGRPISGKVSLGDLEPRGGTAGKLAESLGPLVSGKKDSGKYLVIDLQVRLHNVRAAVPLFTSDLTYVNNALIRPIVAYINSHRTNIPVSCRVVKKVSDFEGSWTIYDSLLMDDISAEVYDAFVKYVADDERRIVRMKKVGFWSLQMFLQLLLVSLGTIA